MKCNTLINRATLAGTAIFLSASAGAFAGEPGSYIAPPPAPSDCDGCINPGFYVEGALLYLNSYASSDIDGYEGDWDLGYRGAIGFENASGLFAELSGFYYQGDYDTDNQFLDGEVTHYYIDAVVGDNIHCGDACLYLSAGLRWGGFELDEDIDFPDPQGTRKGNGRDYSRSYEFEGWGPVIKLDGTRAINDRFGIYAELAQSLLFGEGEYKSDEYKEDDDTLAAITEIGLGLEYKFALRGVDAFVRAGIEGQYWLVDSSDHGLFGGVIKIGGRF